MQWKFAIATAALLALAAGPGPLSVASVHAAGNCDPGQKLDGSTATDAKKKIEAAGYSQVRDLKKGCDNVWHAKAAKGAKAVNIALTPQGQVFEETD